jgi:hypothetical protein
MAEAVKLMYFDKGALWKAAAWKFQKKIEGNLNLN